MNVLLASTDCKYKMCQLCGRHVNYPKEKRLDIEYRVSSYVVPRAGNDPATYHFSGDRSTI